MAKLQQTVTAEDHAQGPASAKYTLVEYGDFQCPDAGYAAPIVKRLQRHFGEDLRFVFRHFPLTRIHRWAEPAAELAEFAAGQDRFWQMHDALFSAQAELNAALLPEFATAQGLDGAAARKAIEAHTHAQRIAADVEGGKASGVHGTPTFFINGRHHAGAYEYEDLLAAIAGG